MNSPINLVKDYSPGEGEANIYGIIIYTKSCPHIKKVINDNDYWDCFDELSGNKWKVFSVRLPLKPKTKPRQESNDFTMFSRMVAIPDELEVNFEIAEKFGLDKIYGFLYV